MTAPPLPAREACLIAVASCSNVNDPCPVSIQISKPACSDD